MKCGATGCIHNTGLQDKGYLCRCCSDIHSPRYNEKLDCSSISSKITIPRDIAEEINSDLFNWMNSYHYNSQGSDYSCNFCHEYGQGDNQSINHKDNCLGVKLEKILFSQLR